MSIIAQSIDYCMFCKTVCVRNSKDPCPPAFKTNSLLSLNNFKNGPQPGTEVLASRTNHRGADIKNEPQWHSAWISRICIHRYSHLKKKIISNTPQQY